MRGRGARGAGLLGCLFWIALAVAALYVGSRFAVPYTRYLRFKDAMQGQAQAAEVNSDVEIRQFLLETADRLEIPLDPRALRVARGAGEIRIAARWTEQVVLPKYARTLTFEPEARAPVAGSPP